MRRRWEITVLEEEDEAEIVKSEIVWDLLKDWITPQEADLERQAVYTFRSAVALDWKVGRLMLAGDSAHLTPPFMGQGMCAGIRDASNLAWKLALVCKDMVPSALLETYQSERRPLAKEYILTAMRIGGLINTLWSEEALNNAFKQDDGSMKMKSIVPELGIGLGPLDDPLRGFVFPQPLLKDGTPLDEKIGYEPVLIASEEIAAQLGDSSAFSTISTVGEPSLQQALMQMKVEAVLVRADRYIYGSALSLEGVEKLVTQFLQDTQGNVSH